MKKQIFLLFTFFAALPFSVFSVKNVAPLNPYLVYEGRVMVKKDSASFCYPGTSVRLSFTGSEIAVELKDNAGYYWVEIDSMKPYKLSTHNKKTASSVYVLAKGLDHKKHNVQLTLINEGLFSHPQLYRFVLPDSTQLSEVRAKKHRIEFIGNSMTCGYGVESASKEEDFADSTENFALAYSGLVARHFDAEPMVVARSGIGIYRNFAGPKRGSVNPLPTFYDKTFIFDSPEWNFESFSPEIVCVCLGTNDLSTARYSLKLFHRAYYSFIKHVRSIYPNARIILVSGSMLTERRLQDQIRLLDGIYNRLKAEGEDNLYRFDFSPLDGSLGYGANWHPSKPQQRIMADELIRFIEKIVGWK